MRKRWVVYRFDTKPPPNDFVKGMGHYWTRWGALRRQRELGPTAPEWIEVRESGIYQAPEFYFSIMRLPKRRLRWWWPWETIEVPAYPTVEGNDGRHIAVIGAIPRFEQRRRWRGWRHR